MFEDLKFELGKNYRLIKSNKIIVDYIHKTDHFYAVLPYKNKTRPSDGSWIIYKDLPKSMHMYAGFSKEGNGIKIICIDDGRIIFDGDVQEKNEDKINNI